MNDHDFLDIGVAPVWAIHSTGCECTECGEGGTVPLEDASSEDLARYVLGRVKNESYLTDHQLRMTALDFVRKARFGVPDTHGEPCPTWEHEGHRGHHWYLLASERYVCACGAMYREKD